jgi:hypothetical protein
MDNSKREKKIRIWGRFWCEWTDSESSLKKMSLFTHLNTTTDLGDHFEVKSSISVTISNPPPPQLQLAVTKIVLGRFRV